MRRTYTSAALVVEELTNEEYADKLIDTIEDNITKLHGMSPIDFSDSCILLDELSTWLGRLAKEASCV